MGAEAVADRRLCLDPARGVDRVHAPPVQALPLDGGVTGDQQISSHRSASPLSTRRIASIATAGAPADSAASIAVRIRG